MESPLLLRSPSASQDFSGRRRWRTKRLLIIIISTTLTLAVLVLGLVLSGNLVVISTNYSIHKGNDDGVIVESEKGVVAADDARCSEIGASILRENGHAIDAAVATALCVGVVNPMASGIGGGGFMVVRSAETSETIAYDFRETAPEAASENMYEKNPTAKTYGALAMGVPGEIAGLHDAWKRNGRLPWKKLFQPAIELARDGFVVAAYLAVAIAQSEKMILSDPGLQQVFAPNRKLLKAGDTCYNVELSRSLQAIAEQGPRAFYNGAVGQKLVKDVREAGGVLSMDDLQNYEVEITEAVAVNTLGYTIYGLPPPSSGTVGLALIANIFDSFEDPNAAKGALGLHRLIEAMKHMFAVRMNLGDPDFVNISDYVTDMLSPSFAKQFQKLILDNTTFPPEYYMYRWSQLQDHGTSHFCIVDADRNAVSITTTVNYRFGGGVLSPSTGIVLNNEMDDFSTPTDISPDKLPPAPSNFIRPNKRPLSSMTPIIITQNDQLVGVMGGSGGMNIIPAVTQVFMNHFVLGMNALDAVQSPRVYHTLIPNVVRYENWTVIDGEHIELSGERKHFLETRGHQLQSIAGGAICQLIVQSFSTPIDMGRKHLLSNQQILHGTLTAVSDPRKDGRPAAV
uniref:Glutathione hydrolase n=2 Tax=Kalanchoe fedtschenkoi TaxID=63787 RepID=A0A7N0TR27_KALFE